MAVCSRPSVDGERVQQRGRGAKVHQRHVAQQRCDVALDGGDRSGVQHRVTASDAGILHRGTVTVGDLAVAELQQNRHCLAGLPYRAEAGRDRITGIDKSIAGHTGADGGLVIGEEA